MRKFDKLFNLLIEEITNNIDTRRKGLQKIDKLNTKNFLDFLREILPLFKENKLNLDEVTITEKPDGSAIRLIMNNDNLLFESSYSGVVEWDKMPFPEQAKWMKFNLEDKLKEISHKIGFNFKIIGELIWCDQLVENEKVTPVGASYLAKYFGTKGGIIIIDLKKIENNTLIDLENDEFFKLTALLKGISNDEFKFYSKQEDMKFNKSIELSLDIDQLVKMLQLPEYNKDRYTVKDKKIIEEVDQIKNEFLDQLEYIINSTQGHFSEKGDLIEGLVLTVLKSGNEYGVFSRGYKDMKSKYNHYSADIENAENELLQNIFGYQIMSKIRSSYDNLNFNAYEEKFNDVWPAFLKLFKTNFNLLKNDSTIPLATKMAQLQILNKKLNKFNRILNFKDFLNEYRIGEKFNI